MYFGLDGYILIHFTHLYKSNHKYLYYSEKFKLLNLIERRVGVKMRALNQVVPRTWTTQEIHR